MKQQATDEGEGEQKAPPSNSTRSGDDHGAGAGSDRARDDSGGARDETGGARDKKSPPVSASRGEKGGSSERRSSSHHSRRRDGISESHRQSSSRVASGSIKRDGAESTRRQSSKLSSRSKSRSKGPQFGNEKLAALTEDLALFLSEDKKSSSQGNTTAFKMLCSSVYDDDDEASEQCPGTNSCEVVMTVSAETATTRSKSSSSRRCSDKRTDSPGRKRRRRSSSRTKKELPDQDDNECSTLPTITEKKASRQSSRSRSRKEEVKDGTRRKKHEQSSSSAKEDDSMQQLAGNSSFESSSSRRRHGSSERKPSGSSRRKSSSRSRSRRDSERSESAPRSKSHRTEGRATSQHGESDDCRKPAADKRRSGERRRSHRTRKHRESSRSSEATEETSLSSALQSPIIDAEDPYLSSALPSPALQMLPEIDVEMEESSAMLFQDESEYTSTKKKPRSKASARGRADFTNEPHPALETPLLYFILKSHPKILSATRAFYNMRWDVTYPLQNRIPCSRWLRKVRIILTWGELLLLLPFFALLIMGMVYSLISPNVSTSGNLSRTPLILAFITAMRNNCLTFCLGLPVERAIKYHKLSALLAYVNGLLHTIVAYRFSGGEGEDKNDGNFLFRTSMHSGGTMLVVVLTIMVASAQPFVRNRVFELFYLVHIVCALGMILCAFFHTGLLVPILGGLSWGLDLAIRKVYMPYFRYPRKAKLQVISDTVVEMSFPKQQGFDFNPGQYVYLAVPKLGFLEWHPFSLSSSSKQKTVTLHIRKAGNWTGALYALAKKQQDVDILMEGPYGSVGVDVSNPYKYPTVMLFSGGIGVTPMQSLCNSLMYEHNHGMRKLRKLKFVWIERDPVIMPEVDVVRRQSMRHLDSMRSSSQGFAVSSSRRTPLEVSALDISTRSGPDGATNLAQQLLSQIPPGRDTDEQLAEIYPSTDFDDNPSTNYTGITMPPTRQVTFLECNSSRTSIGVPESAWHGGTESFDDQSFLDKAFGAQEDQDGPIEVKVYLTKKKMSRASKQGLPPFVTIGRPDVDTLFQEARYEALQNYEHRVAVCVCAPSRIVELCRRACAKYSDRYVAFDFHSEVFE